MPPLEIVLGFAQMLLTIGSFVFAMRVAVTKLEVGLDDLRRQVEAGNAEAMRQLGALHKRMDHQGQEIREVQVARAVLEERVNHIMRGQPFKGFPRFSLPEEDKT